jgi:hypothetical protein
VHRGSTIALCTIATALVVTAVAPAPRKEPRLALRLESGARREFWRASKAPTVWTDADARLAREVNWRAGQAGIEWAELPIAGRGEARALKLVMARIDPAVASLHLVWGGSGDRPSWSVAQAGDAALAINAGMFVDRMPWGWVVTDGWERLAPGQGPLSSALIGLRDGRLIWVDGDDVSAWRGRDVAFAFQSYPTLLTADGRVPVQLQEPGSINLTHRDGRLALGLDRAGRVLVVMTRFDTAIPAVERLPLGLSVPEMAAVMGSLGARQAMLLDGGISAQLALRDASGAIKDWKGIRTVPLGLVAQSRPR